MDADFRPIFLDAELGIRLGRVEPRRNDASDANRQIATQQENYEIGRLDWPVVDASSSPAQTLERSLACLLPRKA
jgi:hypothetical protein